MLQITIEEDSRAVGITLDGSVAGMDVADLCRAWAELAPRRGTRQLKIDLRGVTESDTAGVLVLGEIYSRTNAKLMAGTLSECLALDVMYGQENGVLIDACEWLATEMH
jgi:ABC-type transporter Mla MlaB component